MLLPLFCPPRAAEWFFLWDTLVPSFPRLYCTSSCVTFLDIFARARTPTHVTRGDCSDGSIFSRVNLDPRLPPHPQISTGSSGSASPASLPKPEPCSFFTIIQNCSRLLITRKMYNFFLNVHRKLCWIHKFCFVFWSGSWLHPSEIRDLCTSQVEPWGPTLTPCQGL